MEDYVYICSEDVDEHGESSLRTTAEVDNTIVGLQQEHVHNTDERDQTPILAPEIENVTEQNVIPTTNFENEIEQSLEQGTSSTGDIQGTSENKRQNQDTKAKRKKKYKRKAISSG